MLKNFKLTTAAARQIYAGLTLFVMWGITKIADPKLADAIANLWNVIIPIVFTAVFGQDILHLAARNIRNKDTSQGGN